MQMVASSVKKSFDAMVASEATFKADLEKLLKNEGHMPEDKFLVMSRKGKRLGGAFASTPRGEGGAGSLKFKTKSPRCLREPCFVFRASRNDHDVALAANPLFAAEAEFHSVLHRVSRTAPSRLTGSALTGRQPYGDTLKSVPNRQGSPQRDGSGGYQCAPVLGSRSFWWPSPRALASRRAVQLMT